MSQRGSKHTSGGWDAAAHQLWIEGDGQAAINRVLSGLNAYGAKKPLPALLQFVFYLYHADDAATGALVLEGVRRFYPGDPSLLLNLAVCLLKSGQLDGAEQRLDELLAMQPNNTAALDVLCALKEKQGQYERAADAGTRALHLLDVGAGAAPPGWSLPQTDPKAWLAERQRTSVISFSLWGSESRYLRGAIDNALAAPALYPGWQVRFYVDDTVPAEFRAVLSELGATVRMEPRGQTLRQRLTWRFKVADDSTVGRFIVRDADSLINAREQAAVQAWIDSGRWFHVMRDWWSHNTPILAGMWGGIAGVLPNLAKQLDRYVPPSVGGRHVDQWFLRDQLWRYVRASCLVHDRCFASAGAQPWPTPTPPAPIHVGMNEIAIDQGAQESRLRSLLPARIPGALERLACLSL